MKRLFIILFVSFSSLVVLALLVGGYLGFVPYVSSLFGSDKPRDLGVRYKPSDVNLYNQKANFTVEKSNTVSSPLGVDFSGEADIKEVFTKEEISSKLNYSLWKYMPIKNVQVNFPENDMVEFSANLLVEKIPDFLSAVGFAGVSREDIDKGMQYVKSVNPPIYARGKVKVSDNHVDLNLISVEVGRLSVPFESYDGNNIVKTVAEKIFVLVPNFYVKSASFSPSGMSFEGKVPTKGVILQ